MRLLAEIPDAILWLIDDNSTTTQNLRNHAKAANADLSRILFSSRTPHKEFCARLQLCDVYLDTYPYNCGSTTNDVIRAGVPLVTQYGPTMVSRMGLSMLSAVGAQKTVSQDLESYQRIVQEIHQTAPDQRYQFLANCSHAIRLGEI